MPVDSIFNKSLATRREAADIKIIGGVNNRFPYVFVARGNIATPAQRQRAGAEI